MYLLFLLSVLWGQVSCWHISLLGVTGLNQPPLLTAYPVVGTQQGHHLACSHAELCSVLCFKVIENLKF